jgi:hypothetical protein
MYLFLRKELFDIISVAITYTEIPLFSLASCGSQEYGQPQTMNPE